jgi:putative CocE/NonD family hydrolase
VLTDTLDDALAVRKMADAASMAVRALPPQEALVREIDGLWIPLSDGARLSARLWLPPQAETEPVPAVVEVSPYRHEDSTRRRDSVRHPYFAEHGYASLRIDIRGSGSSDGVIHDEYSEREQQDVCEALAWVAAQPWSTGSVGMIGISWGGFAALQAAARRPLELKAVVVVCASADRYGADVKYRGGALLGCELLPWSTTMLAMSIRPPDPSLAGEHWRELWLERLEQTVPFAETWLGHQHRDEYWQTGSPCEDYAAIECPVYVVGGWADPYRQAVLDLLEELDCPRKGLIGPWSHQYPEEGTPGPAIDFRRECVRWWDEWLRGEETGIMRESQLRVWMQEGVSPGVVRRRRRGRWVEERAWPSRRISVRRYWFGEGTLARRGPAPRALSISADAAVGSAAGSWCPWGPTELPDDQRGEDSHSLCFTSQPLTARTEILGSAAVTLELSADRPLALVAVRLCDVAPSGASTLVARGLLNLAHRVGSAHPAPLEPGRVETVRVPLDAAAYAFRPGHRLRVAVSPSYWPWAWPSPEPVTLTVRTGASVLELPVRPPRPGDGKGTDFADPPDTHGLDGDCKKTVEYDRTARRRTITVDRIRKRRLAREDGLEVEGAQKDVFGISSDDPLSATVECERRMAMRSGEWSVAVEASSTMSADAATFRLFHLIQAYENGERIYSRERSFEVPRSLV